MEQEWVGFIYFDPLVVMKLREKHDGLTPREVRQAVSCGAHDSADWEDHPEYGRRLVMRGTPANGRQLISYLRPLDRTDGTWECLTAWRLD